MAFTQFLPAPLIRRYVFTQYSQGSVAAFATQFATDWAAFLPNAGAGLGVVAKPGAATVAEVIIAPGQVLELSPLDWIGNNYGTWSTVLNALMGRTVADGATNTNTTVTSATAAFVSQDVGAIIAGVGIPSGATILQINSGTSVGISATATATATGLALTITRSNAAFTPDII